MSARLLPLIRGGTGSRSDSEEQPDWLPDRYESGTLNVMGLAGLNASLEWLLARGIASIRMHSVGITRQLINGLQSIPGITIQGTCDAERQTGTVSFSIIGVSPSDAGLWLDEEFNIQSRIGLHCAPAAHRTLSTFPTGTIRFATGIFTCEADVERALDAVRTIAGRCA